MKNYRTASVSAITLAALTGTVQATSDKSVLQTIAENPDHTIFIEAATAVGLDGILERDTGFTLFLPTDDALEEAALDIDISEPLSPDEKERLQELLLNHIVEDELFNRQIISQKVLSLETAAGEPLHIEHDGTTTTVNSASLLKPDLKADNGVVHVIDSILKPPAIITQ